MKDLRTARKDIGLNQYGVATQIGITVASYSRIETGKAKPRASTQAAIEKVLKQQIDWLTTSGFDSVGGEPNSWTSSEQNLRQTLKDIKTLQGKPERKKYIETARYYLDILENEYINLKQLKQYTRTLEKYVESDKITEL
jgi:transcriptional regulator with XRE-family HTH domain